MTGLLANVLVTIVVHNLASVPTAELAAAQSSVEHLLNGSGVAVSWEHVSSSSEFAVQLMIRRGPDKGAGTRSPFVLGTTIREERASGGSCCVFYEHVLRFAHRYNRPVVAILALVIGHELGHVLLPAPAHTATGLMKAEWNDDDVRHFTQGTAPFTARQFELMRAAIARGDVGVTAAGGQ